MGTLEDIFDETSATDEGVTESAPAEDQIAAEAAPEGENEGAAEADSENPDVSADKADSATADKAKEADMEPDKPAGAEQSEQGSSATPADDVGSDADKGLMAALQDERRKRQEYEKQVADFQKQLEDLKQPREEEPRPDLLVDPNGFTKRLETDIERRLFAERLNVHEAMARKQYPDFDDAMGAFEQGVRENPALYHAMANQPYPAEFAYQWGKKAKFMQEVGSPDEYQKKVREELSTELQKDFDAKVAAAVADERAKIKAEIEEAEKNRSDLPDSLAGARNTGSRSGPAWSGPTPLEDAFK